MSISEIKFSIHFMLIVCLWMLIREFREFTAIEFVIEWAPAVFGYILALWICAGINAIYKALFKTSDPQAE